MQKLWREPLVHFVALALLVFASYELLMRYRASADNTIVVTAAQMERMAALFAGESGALPGADDMRAMVTDHVRQQALIREAKRLGLDRDDIVIDRRLAQKMNFMLTDLATPPEPSKQQVRDWYQAHADKFRRAERRSFQHVFFADPDDPRARQMLAQLRNRPDADWRRLGDPFMLQREYANLPKREVTRLFGNAFADELFALKPGQAEWSGPWTSSYGGHVTRLGTVIPTELPPLEDIRQQVADDWREQQARRLNAEAIAKIIERYEVEIEGIDD